MILSLLPTIDARSMKFVTVTQAIAYSGVFESSNSLKLQFVF